MVEFFGALEQRTERTELAQEVEVAGLIWTMMSFTVGKCEKKSVIRVWMEGLLDGLPKFWMEGILDCVRGESAPALPPQQKK